MPYTDFLATTHTDVSSPKIDAPRWPTFNDLAAAKGTTLTESGRLCRSVQPLAMMGSQWAGVYGFGRSGAASGRNFFV